MTYEKLARTLDAVLADNVRLKDENDRLRSHLAGLCNLAEGVEIVASRPAEDRNVAPSLNQRPGIVPR